MQARLEEKIQFLVFSLESLVFSGGITLLNSTSVGHRQVPCREAKLLRKRFLWSLPKPCTDPKSRAKMEFIGFFIFFLETLDKVK